MSNISSQLQHSISTRKSNKNENPDGYFIITGKAFHTLNQLMKYIYTHHKYGTFIMGFHPTSKHIVLNYGYRRAIVLAKQLPTIFPFQWHFNTKFAKDWDDFSRYVSNNELVYVSEKLLSVDNHQKEVFVGGGTGPTDQPYTFDSEEMKAEFEANDNILSVY